MSLGSLTKREKETLKYLVLGFSNKEIARELNISSHAIKIHVAKIIQKINAKNRTHAAYIVGSLKYSKNQLSID